MERERVWLTVDGRGLVMGFGDEVEVDRACKN